MLPCLSRFTSQGVRGPLNSAQVPLAGPYQHPSFQTCFYVSLWAQGLGHHSLRGRWLQGDSGSQRRLVGVCSRSGCPSCAPDSARGSLVPAPCRMSSGWARSRPHGCEPVLTGPVWRAVLQCAPWCCWRPAGLWPGSAARPAWAPPSVAEWASRLCSRRAVAANLRSKPKSGTCARHCCTCLRPVPSTLGGRLSILPPDPEPQVPVNTLAVRPGAAGRLPHARLGCPGPPLFPGPSPAVPMHPVFSVSAGCRR